MSYEARRKAVRAKMLCFAADLIMPVVAISARTPRKAGVTFFSASGVL